MKGRKPNTFEEQRLYLMSAEEYIAELNGSDDYYAPPYEDEKTGLDVAYRLALNTYSDVYKDVWGVRPSTAPKTLYGIECAIFDLYED